MAEDPITWRLSTCALAVGSPELVTNKHREIQGSGSVVQAVRPAPGTLLLFKDWEQIPEWLVGALFGYFEVVLGFEAAKYRLPGLFEKADDVYDLVNDRTVVFRTRLEVPPAVLDYYADKLSESDPRYQFSQLDGDLVAMVSSGLTSDSATELVAGCIRDYSTRNASRSRYVVTGSASARYTGSGEKLRIPYSFVIEKTEYRRILDKVERAREVLPRNVKAAAIIEQLGAWDDLDCTLDKCRKYIEEEQCTSTVVLFADVYSKRHKRKFDEVHTFKLVGGRVEHECTEDPEYVDLSPGIPGCRVYFCYSASKFKSAMSHDLTPASELIDLLCEAVASGDEEGMKKFTCGLFSVNLVDRFGCLPLVEACKTGNEDMVQWLLQEGGDTDLADGDGIWPYLAAVQSGMAANQHHLQLRSCSHKINAGTLNDAVHAKKERLVQALVAAGVDPSWMDDDGEVPLVSASMKLSSGALGVVAEASSDLNVEDRFGITALQSAKKRGQEYVDALLSVKRMKATYGLA